MVVAAATVWFGASAAQIIRSGGFNDFSVIVSGASDLASGRSPYDAEASRDFGRRSSYIYPPFLATVVMPVRRFGPSLARAYAVLGVLLYLAAFVLILETEGIAWRSPPFYGLALAFALFEPALDTLSGAEHEFLFLFLFVLVQYSLRRHPRAQSLMGICLALGAIVKIYPACLVAYAALRRWWIAVFAFAMTFGVLTAISVSVVGWRIERQYWQDILPVLARGTDWIENQSLLGFFSRFFVDGRAFYAEPPVLPSATVLARIAGLVITAITAVVIWRYDRPERVMAALLPLLLLIAPVAWMNYELLLLLPLGILAGLLWKEPHRGRTALLLCSALIVAFGDGCDLTYRPQWIFESYKFFGVLGFWVSGVWALAQPV